MFGVNSDGVRRHANELAGLGVGKEWHDPECRLTDGRQGLRTHAKRYWSQIGADFRDGVDGSRLKNYCEVR